MKNTKFNYYNTLSRKIAAVLPKDDAGLDKLIDKVVDNATTSPGIVGSISKPFKKLYFNIIANKDNLRKGIRNLYDPTANAIKQNLGDYIGNDFSKYLKNNVLNDTSKAMSYFGDGISSIFKNNPNNTFNKINNLYKQSIPVNKIKDLINKNIDKKDIFNKLNSGYFNNPTAAKSYADKINKHLKSSLFGNKFKSIGVDPIGMLAKYKAISEISNLEKSLLNK